MNIEDVARSLAKRGVEYSIGKPAIDLQIAGAETRLDIKFPIQVRLFYRHYNGLRVDDPPLEILPLDQLEFIAPHRIHFATFDSQHRVCFDTSRFNQAEQWSIISTDEYTITMTMASLWSNKIWHWIDQRRPVWTSYSYD